MFIRIAFPITLLALLLPVSSSAEADINCVSSGNATMCTMSGLPPSVPTVNSYQRLTEQQVWNQRRCFVKVSDQIAETQRKCSRMASETECWKVSSECKWQAGKSQCWAPIYVKCASALSGKCSEVTLGENMTGNFSRSRQFSCEQDIERALIKPLNSKNP